MLGVRETEPQIVSEKVGVGDEAGSVLALQVLHWKRLGEVCPSYLICFTEIADSLQYLVENEASWGTEMKSGRERKAPSRFGWEYNWLWWWCEKVLTEKHAGFGTSVGWAYCTCQRLLAFSPFILLALLDYSTSGTSCTPCPLNASFMLGVCVLPLLSSPCISFLPYSNDFVSQIPPSLPLHCS